MLLDRVCLYGTSASSLLLGANRCCEILQDFTGSAIHKRLQPDKEDDALIISAYSPGLKSQAPS